MTTTADWIDELERKAKAATPGPWIADHSEEDNSAVKQEGRSWWDGLAFCGRPADAEFIAAANPAAILRLIAALDSEGTSAMVHRDLASLYREERDALAARLAAVEALHRVDPNSGHNPDCPCGRPAYDGQRCSHCRLPWPCPTSAALSAAPTDTTKEN